MIKAITLENAHLSGGVLPSLFRLRKKMFVDLQGWEIPTFNGMEYDAYDNPATTYLVYTDENDKALGMVRLYPTDRQYMLSDVWPEIVEYIDLPKSINIWEGSRFVIDNDLSRELRTKIKHELVCAFLEFGISKDIEEYIGVMPPKIWESVFINSGWPIQKLGETISLPDGSEIYAGQFKVSKEQLLNVRKKTGIYYDVLIEDQDQNLEKMVA